MPSAFNTPSSSATIESLNHLSGSSLSHNRISTVGRDLHETHNHYYHDPGWWSAGTHRGIFGRILMGIVETFKGASSQFGSTERVPRETIKTLDELHSRKAYRVHSAKFKQHFAVVKVFHGRRAKESFVRAVRLNKSLLHPSILEMVAVSSRTCDTPFIIFDSNCETGSVEVRIASALETGLSRSISLGFRIVGGMSAALDYLAATDMPWDTLCPENFEIYITRDDDVKVGIDLDNVGRASNGHNNADALWELLDSLCVKTFKDASRLLYADEGFDEEDLPISEVLEDDIEMQSPALTSANDVSQTSTTGASSVASPRREMSWKRSQRGSRTVASVARQYRNHLRVNSGHPYAESLRLRKLEGGIRRQHISHRCQGYNKEEITLTSDVQDAALILHRIPSPGEKCSVCGEIVKMKEVFRCHCGLEDDGVSSTIKCSKCGVWQHRQCTQGTDLQRFTCSYCKADVIAATAITVGRKRPVHLPRRRRHVSSCNLCGQDFTAPHSLRGTILTMTILCSLI